MEAQKITKILPHINEVECLNEKDIPVMKELHDVLKKHGALNRFGITLMHQHFEIAEDEVLLETTDIENRVQMIQPVKKHIVDNLEGIETAWRLDTGMPMMSCKCVMRNGHHEHLHLKGEVVTLVC